jgi:hypothetical protein
VLGRVGAAALVAVGEVVDEGLQEAQVPAADAVHARGESGFGAPLAQSGTQQLGRPGDGQRSDRQPVGPAVPEEAGPEPGRSTFLVPLAGDHQQDPGRGQPAGEVEQASRRLGVGVLDVVDGDDQRRSAGQGQDLPAELVVARHLVPDQAVQRNAAVHELGDDASGEMALHR